GDGDRTAPPRRVAEARRGRRHLRSAPCRSRHPARRARRRTRARPRRGRVGGADDDAGRLRRRLGGADVRTCGLCPCVRLKRPVEALELTPTCALKLLSAGVDSRHVERAETSVPAVTSASLALFGSSIFVGAALVFLLEPMVGKMLLPLLGGAAAVWLVTLVFFQAVLLGGYAFAHVSIRLLGVRRQTVAQLLLVLLP